MAAHHYLVGHFVIPSRYLCHVYAAEALIRLGRTAEAIRHLSPEHVADLTVGVQTATADAGGQESDAALPVQEVSLPFTTETAKAVLIVNLASAYCVQGDLDAASRCLSQVR